MIIDCHGHYTTAPKALSDYRERLLQTPEAVLATLAGPKVADDQIREGLEGAQVKLQRARGIDLTLFSPRASAMGHHLGTGATSLQWSRICNDLIARVVELYPAMYVGVCQLPQSPDAPPASSIPELRRCVQELGFVGCNLSPDPSGGHWRAPPLTDRSWYPLYEAMVELDVPAMVHVSSSCNPSFHTTGAHYINADTTAFMQLVQGNLFRDFPRLRLVIPHGGGAVPFHWGRYRGLAQDLSKPPLTEHVLRNVFFDTCVYHQPGIDLLLEVIPAENILFGSEMVGAVRGIDPETGFSFDDTRRYIEGSSLGEEDRRKVFETNARRVYPRLDALLAKRGNAEGRAS